MHKFMHKHFMALIDLAELDQLKTSSVLFGRVWSPYSFRENDYLPDPNVAGNLSDRVNYYVREAGCREEIHSIRLLTNPRVFGYVFNPISLFFCFGKNGEAVSCLVEVGNTFGEKKAYVLPCRQNHNGYKRFQATMRKLFYISPFSELEQNLRFDIPLPDENLSVHVDTLAGTETVVAASLIGKRLDWNTKNLFDLSLRYPLAALRVITLIHAHAFILWLKKVPFYEKGESRELQQNVLRPHQSLLRTDAERGGERGRERGSECGGEPSRECGGECSGEPGRERDRDRGDKDRNREPDIKRKGSGLLQPK